ncbi:HAMP domain-containing protein [Saccharibacter sp. 17.LH.SD]|uniref:sensor histidine kinase n=1 Tax=Saccharibacter sp. 17.LH.SD TaxID=2689393 RepID=UPI00136AB6A9|nr:ATP-binding protein [Saccharibacter sp. 17.LH.SD]MXV43749.1 HAMP domain-containing protein [Saccharibacter sp. 17.LH.SD]
MTRRSLFTWLIKLQHWFSPLLGRMLLVNILPLILLAGMLLYINQYQRSLLEADVTALREQAHIYAGALGESAVRRGGWNAARLDVDLARPLLKSLMDSSLNAHARLYDLDGRLSVDSHRDFQASHPEQGGNTSEGRWEPPQNSLVDRFYAWILLRLPLTSDEGPVPLDNSADSDENSKTIEKSGKAVPAQVELPPYIRRTDAHELVITVVEPIIHDGKTLGEIQLTRHAPEIDRSLFAVRSSILSLLLLTLCVTVFLSWYLSLTIARPLRRLVAASHDMREPGSGKGREDCVPQNLLSRKDEIGSLARALRRSTLALWARLDDTERFAAEVSHELKNPLSSIRSALETLPRIRDLKARDRLLEILQGDVLRLNRLITDISDASRVEGDLRRGQRDCVDIVSLLGVIVEMHQTTRSEDDTILVLKTASPADTLCVRAIEDRLVQVLRNLISNAISFSPPRGVITIHVAPCRGEERATGEHSLKSDIEICVEDEGPGVPPTKLESIFERFYSERPGNERFGQHSGLGLAISRQIIQALDGELYAENRYDKTADMLETNIIGARFVVRLPRCG